MRAVKRGWSSPWCREARWHLPGSRAGRPSSLQFPPCLWHAAHRAEVGGPGATAPRSTQKAWSGLGWSQDHCTGHLSWAASSPRWDTCPFPPNRVICKMRFSPFQNNTGQVSQTMLLRWERALWLNELFYVRKKRHNKCVCARGNVWVFTHGQCLKS